MPSEPRIFRERLRPSAAAKRPIGAPLVLFPAAAGCESQNEPTTSVSMGRKEKWVVLCGDSVLYVCLITAVVVAKIICTRPSCCGSRPWASLASAAIYVYSARRCGKKQQRGRCALTLVLSAYCLLPIVRRFTIVAVSPLASLSLFVVSSLYASLSLPTQQWHYRFKTLTSSPIASLLLLTLDGARGSCQIPTARSS